MGKVVYVLSDGTSGKQNATIVPPNSNTQSQPIAAAKKHVASLPQGTLSQILIQGPGGQWRTEWTYRNDPCNRQIGCIFRTFTGLTSPPCREF